MPNMRSTLRGFSRELTFRKVEKISEEFETKTRVIDDAPFKGVIAPVPSRKLVMKPEGQRDWRWWSLWTSTKLVLGSSIKGSDGRVYKVVNDADYDSFTEYELTEAAI